MSQRPGVLCSFAVLVFAITATQSSTGVAWADDAFIPFVADDLVTSKRLSIDMGAVSWQAGTSISVVTVELDGQVEVAPGTFVFGRLPVSRIDDDLVTETDLGNLSLGGRYCVTRGPLRLAGAIELTFPTAPSYDYESEDGIAAFYAGMTRFSEYGQYAGGTWGVDVHADARYERHRFFVQTQFGYAKDTRRGDAEDLDMLVLSVAGGVRMTDSIVFIAELESFSHALDGAHESDQTHHWLDAGLRYRRDSMFGGARIYLPLDHPISDNDERFPVRGVGFDMGVLF